MMNDSDRPKQKRVLDINGREGSVDAQVMTNQNTVQNVDPVPVHFDDNMLFVDRTLLEQQDDGSYKLTVSADELISATNDRIQVEEVNTLRPGTRTSSEAIPVIEEQAIFSTRAYEASRVRLVKRVDEIDETVDVPTREGVVDVERIKRGDWIDEMPSVRREDDKLIVPVVEEVVVVQKRLRLREEVHVTMRTETTTQRETVRLRKERVEVERIDLQNSANTPDTA